jgi:CRP/FNR family cyclic AMP-dependent transcriptional regulator
MRLQKDQKLERLRRVPIFSGLGGRELEAIGALVDDIDLPAGRALTRQGEPGHEFFIVVDGTVRIERDGRTLTSLGPGDFLGEIALIDGRPRSATAVCEVDSHLLVLGHQQFLSLMADFPAIQLKVLGALAERVRRVEPDV